jgi:hypothetical protein
MAGFVLGTDFGGIRGITVILILRDAEKITICESSRGGEDAGFK